MEIIGEAEKEGGKGGWASRAVQQITRHDTENSAILLKDWCEIKCLDCFLCPLLKKVKLRGSPLSTIFGNWKKSYYAKFVLVE